MAIEKISTESSKNNWTYKTGTEKLNPEYIITENKEKG